MAKNLLLCTVILLLQIAFKGFAQVTVTFPSERAVFQRNHAGQADVYIGGFISETYEKIEARFVPIVAGEGEAAPAGGGWALVDNSFEAGHFYGYLTVRGGWYKLEVRGVKTGGSTQTTAIQRVGVGEVFVVAGQSNATGGDANPNGPGARHDQVNSVNYQNLNGLTSFDYNDSRLPCPEYVHLDANVKTAPFGNYAWCWGAFGDKLYEKLRVPVMIFNAGWASSGMDNWKQSIDPNGHTISAFGLAYPAGQPFGNLRLALNYYAAQLGIRAVLWHQGETDNYLEQPGDNTYSNYLSGLWQVIGATRTLTGKSNLAWMVSRASRFTVSNVSRVSANVINAQNEIVNNDGSYPHVYPGPETDNYYDITYRHDQIHFRGDGVTASGDGNIYSGLIKLAEFWTNKITSSFIDQSEPYSAMPPPQVAAVHNGIQVTFTAPGISPGGQYNWLGTDCNSPQSTSRIFTATPGSYKLKIIDNYKNVVYSPQLFFGSSTLPVTWKSFTAKTGQNGRATIEWSTASEMQSSYFEIERSSDAFRFSAIKRIEAAGDSKVLATYRYEDEFLPSGIYYYRLKQVDLDEKFEYTHIENVKINGNITARAFPNPVSDKLILEAAESLGRVEIANIAGVKMFSSEIKNTTTEIDMASFPRGLYNVRISGKTFRVVK